MSQLLQRPEAGTRRRFLRGIALASASSGAWMESACASRKAAHPEWVFNPRALQPVVVSREQVIRTVVGLRPFRPSGFVVRAETVGPKLVVHNYGHGGGGVTLSWGTAHLAARLVTESGHRDAAVIGAGAVGLATARILLERGVNVTVYAKDLPPNTTSNIAGGQWFPFTVYDADRVTPEFRSQFNEAARFAYRRYQILPAAEYGIRWLPNYILHDRPFQDGGLLSKTGPIADLLPELRDLSPREHPFPFPYVRQVDTMFVEPPIYLAALLREIRIAGVPVHVREITSLPDLQSLPEPVVVNCAGLGAKTLFNDAELIPIRGQLTVLLPQPAVRYAALPSDLYMFPRTDGILLGGTHERGDWNLQPDRATEDRILAAHRNVFSRMRF